MGSVGTPGERRALLVQVAVVASCFVAYAAARRLVEGSADVAHANADRVLALEARLGIDVERPLNEAVNARPWLAEVLAWSYLWLHWISVGLALAILWWRDRTTYLVLRDALVLAAAVGVVLWWRFPVAPPRLLAGFTDTVFGATPDDTGRPPGGSNVYAAFPSYHVGWPLAAGIAVGSTVASRIARLAALVPALVLAPTVIVTANHYVVDLVGGAGISLLCLWLVSRRHTRRPGRPSTPPRPDHRDRIRQLASWSTRRRAPRVVGRTPRQTTRTSWSISTLRSGSANSAPLAR